MLRCFFKSAWSGDNQFGIQDLGSPRPWPAGANDAVRLGDVRSYVNQVRIPLWAGGLLLFSSNTPVYSTSVAVSPRDEYPLMLNWFFRIAWKQSAGGLAIVALNKQPGYGGGFAMDYGTIEAADNAWKIQEIPLSLNNGVGLMYASVQGGNGLSAGIVGEMTIIGRL